MYDYEIVLGHEGRAGLLKHYIDVSACQNFIQAVEIATLAKHDLMSEGWRILEVREKEGTSC